MTEDTIIFLIGFLLGAVITYFFRWCFHGKIKGQDFWDLLGK